MISNQRVEQMIALLGAMSKGTKMPSDGLGIYLGDGIPRPQLGNLRSLELKQALEELAELRKLISSSDRVIPQ